MFYTRKIPRMLLLFVLVLVLSAQINHDDMSDAKSDLVLRGSTVNTDESNATAKLPIVKNQSWNILWQVMRKIKKLPANNISEKYTSTGNLPTQPFDGFDQPVIPKTINTSRNETIQNKIKKYSQKKNKQDPSTRNQSVKVKRSNQVIEEKWVQSGGELIRVSVNKPWKEPSQNKHKATDEPMLKTKPEPKPSETSLQIQPPNNPVPPDPRQLPCIETKNIIQDEINNVLDQIEDISVVSPEAERKDKVATDEVEEETIESSKQDNMKRSAAPDLFYTAKDVAALEIIVDLMENSANDNKPSRIIPLPSPKNNVKVYFAVPYASASGIKRSQTAEKSSDVVRKVRKVFSVQMNTPVDLKYQIQSFEVTEPTTVALDNLSPGIYLLVDNINSFLPGKKIALKQIRATHAVTNPVTSLSNINDKILVIKLKNKTTEKETTSPKNANKITLNKDIVASVNKHLDRLYKTLAAQPNDTEAEHADTQKCEKCENRTFVNRLFGRPFKCKCKAYHPMCINCATCDAVMAEIFIGFDNLNKYMTDHCNEIQAYFFANPTGGRKLIDMVHKIDQNLKCYFRRNSGKCKCKCQTFSCCSYTDKRFSKPNDDQEDNPEFNDMETLTDNLDDAAKSKLCSRSNLKSIGQLFVETAQKCISNETSIQNVSTKNIKRSLRNIYAVNATNKNVISNGDSSTEPTSKYVVLPTHYEPKLGLFYVDKYFPTKETSNHDEDEVEKPIHKKKFKYFFKKKKNKCKQGIGYGKRIVNKRDVEQLGSPLIADSGGSFWDNYWNRVTPLQQYTSENLDPDTNIKVIQRHTPVVTEAPLGKVTSIRENKFDEFFKKYTLAAVETTSLNIEKGTDSAKATSSNNQNYKRSTNDRSIENEKPKGSPNTVTDFNFKVNVYHKPYTSLIKTESARPLITKPNYLPAEIELNDRVQVETDLNDTLLFETESIDTLPVLESTKVPSISNTQKIETKGDPKLKDSKIKDDSKFQVDTETAKYLKNNNTANIKANTTIRNAAIIKELDVSDLKEVVKSNHFGSFKKIESMLDCVLCKLRKIGKVLNTKVNESDTAVESTEQQSIKPELEKIDSETETEKPKVSKNSLEPSTRNRTTSLSPNFGQIWVPTSEPTNNAIDYTTLDPISEVEDIEKTVEIGKSKIKAIDDLENTTYPSEVKTFNSKILKQNHDIYDDEGDSNEIDKFKPTIIPLNEKLKIILNDNDISTQKPIHRIHWPLYKPSRSVNVKTLDKNKMVVSPKEPNTETSMTITSVMDKLNSVTKDVFNNFKDHNTDKTFENYEYTTTLPILTRMDVNTGAKRNVENHMKDIKEIRKNLNKLQHLRKSKKTRNSIVNVLSKHTTKRVPSVIIFDNWEENSIANPTNTKQDHKPGKLNSISDDILELKVYQSSNDTVRDMQLKSLHEDVLDYKNNELNNEIHGNSSIPNDDFIIIIDEEDDDNGQVTKAQKTGSQHKAQDYASGDYDIFKNAKGIFESLKVKFRKPEEVVKAPTKEHKVNEEKTHATVSENGNTESTTSLTSPIAQSVKTLVTLTTQSLMQKLRQQLNNHHENLIDHIDVNLLLPDHDSRTTTVKEKWAFIEAANLEYPDSDNYSTQKKSTEKLTTEMVATEKNSNENEPTKKVTTEKPVTSTPTGIVTISITMKTKTSIRKPKTTTASTTQPETITTKQMTISTKPKTESTAYVMNSKSSEAGKTTETKPFCKTKQKEHKFKHTSTSRPFTQVRKLHLSGDADEKINPITIHKHHRNHSNCTSESRSSTQVIKKFYKERPKPIKSLFSNRKQGSKSKTKTGLKHDTEKSKETTVFEHETEAKTESNTIAVKKDIKEDTSTIKPERNEATATIEKETKEVTATKDLKMKETAATKETTSSTSSETTLPQKEIPKKVVAPTTEACDPTTEPCLCDVLATYQHVLGARSRMSQRDFENYVREVTCHLYKRAPKQFLVEPLRKKPWRRKGNTLDSKKKLYEITRTNDMHSLRWNWIRKRNILSFDGKSLDANDKDDFGYFVKSNEAKVIEKHDFSNVTTDDLDGYEEIEDLNKNYAKSEKKRWRQYETKDRNEFSTTDHRDNENTEGIFKDTNTFEMLHAINEGQIKLNEITTGSYELDEKIIDPNLRNELISVGNNKHGSAKYVSLETNLFESNTKKPLKATTVTAVIELDQDMKDDDGFEEMFKGEGGIYSNERKRRKRSDADLRELVNGLKNLPPLEPAVNEILAMPGDDIHLLCNPHKGLREFTESNKEWTADRDAMLKYNNVIVHQGVVIKGVESRNAGNYTCSQDGVTKRTIRLTVLGLPAFNIIFIPMYTISSNCTYDDLKALQHLGSLMSEAGGCCRSLNSLRIDEPICLQNKDDGTNHVRATAVLSISPTAAVQCSAQCKRDLLGSLALMCANNALMLTRVEVLVSKKGVNKSFTPCQKTYRRSIVTHTLRRKDVSSDPLVHQLSARMAPGDVEVSLSCPPGHYLIARQKICAVCPADTWSPGGESTCYACPPGARAEPGAELCRRHLAESRYDWWWYPPCGYVLAFAAVVCVCSVCALCARASHVTSSRRGHVTSAAPIRTESRWAWGRFRAAATGNSSSAAVVTERKPLSPSRVILAKFFRLSPRSSRISDDRESRFEQWKEQNRPPSLPSIDFDA